MFIVKKSKCVLTILLFWSFFSVTKFDSLEPVCKSSYRGVVSGAALGLLAAVCSGYAGIFGAIWLIPTGAIMGHVHDQEVEAAELSLFYKDLERKRQHHQMQMMLTYQKKSYAEDI